MDEVVNMGQRAFSFRVNMGLCACLTWNSLIPITNNISSLSMPLTVFLDVMKYIIWCNGMACMCVFYPL